MNRNLKLSTFITNRKIFLHLAFFIIAITLSYYFTRFRFFMNKEYHEATLLSLLNGSASVPFQYRALVPWIVAYLHKVMLPLGLIDSHVQLFLLFDWFSVFFLIVAFRHYISLFFTSMITSALLSFTMFYALPLNFLLPRLNNYWYPCDMASIMFFTLALILLYKQKWVMFYMVFAVATLNRETTCFLTFIYLFTAFGKSRFKSIALHCLVQLIIWVAIKYFLYQLYADNPVGINWVCGGLFKSKWHDNIEFITNLRNTGFLFSIVGCTWIPTLCCFSLIRNDFAKRSLLVMLPFFVGMMIVANIMEMRIYGEITPVVLMAILLVLKELFEHRKPAC